MTASEELAERRKKQKVIITIAVLAVVLCCLCLSCFTIVWIRSTPPSPFPPAPYHTPAVNLGGLQVLPTVTPVGFVGGQPTLPPPLPAEPSPTFELGVIASPVVPAPTAVPPTAPTVPPVGAPPELLCPYQLDDASYTDLQTLVYGDTIGRMSPGCTIRVTVRQRTVDEMLPQYAAPAQEFGYQDLRVFLVPGQVLVTGKVQRAFLTVPLEGGLKPKAEDCRLTAEITYLRIGGVDAPQWARDQVMGLVCESAGCVWESPMVCFDSVELNEGALTVNATKR